MLDRLDRARRTHLHGVVAGSVLVVATFLAVTVPEAVVRLLRGQIDLAALTPLALVALLATFGVREARAWHRGDARRAAA